MIKNTQNGLKIFVLTCREVGTDFRYALAQALHELGHEVVYIHLKRRPVVSHPPGVAMKEMSFRSLLDYLGRATKTDKNVLFFNSTNLAFPLLTAFLRFLFGGIWVFDVHDDLTYGRTGLQRLRARISEEILSHSSDIILHAAPTLRERFPASLHFANASDVRPINRENLDRKNVLILTSIDRRFDFDYLRAVARLCPDIQFHVFGNFSGNDHSVKSDFGSMVEELPNVFYFGGYENADIERILGQYFVTLCPYCQPSVLTYFIDPLRFYHCLNSGMEVISTPIPRAVDLQSNLHVAATAVEAASVLQGLREGTISPKNSGDFHLSNNWKTRAVELLSFLGGTRHAVGEAN